MKKLFLLLILPLIISSCSDDDKNDAGNGLPNLESGNYLYVLNQGGWKANNASLSLVNLDKNTVTSQFFEALNNFNLGDVAEKIIKYENKAFISVSGSDIVKIINLQNGESLGSITLSKSTFPKRLKIVDNTLFVCGLDSNKIYTYDLDNYNLLGEYETGPNPEDFEIYNNKIYVLNSAKGVVGVENGATLYIIDLNSSETVKVSTKFNPSNIEIDETNNKYYISNIGKWDDTENKMVGQGISEYNLIDNSFVNSWEIENSGRIEFNNNTLYVLSDLGVWGNSTLYEFKGGTATKLIEKPEKFTAFNNFEIHGDKIIMFDVQDYQSDGNIYIYDDYYQLENSYSAGIIPNSALFYTF